MKGFVQGADRQQTTLLPDCLDDWVDESNPVRAVDVFVDALELRDLGFDGVDPAATGRPAYHPSPMLKLYIYGYLNRVQSSRRLEREAGRNLEVMWLTGRLVPDHKTIADFRKDNGCAIKKVCGQFVALCRKMGLLAKASVAIDGSKFKAVNSRDNNFTKGKMDRRLAQIEESVARYLSQLDTADRQTAAGEDPSEELAARTTRLKEKLAKLEEEVKRLKAIEKQMLAAPGQQISFTDPDSRSMATSGRGSGMVGYNVQAAVDTANHLIVAHEVSNVGTDKSQLANMANPRCPCWAIGWTASRGMAPPSLKWRRLQCRQPRPVDCITGKSPPRSVLGPAALREYVEHFHAERNDQGKGNVLLFPRDTNIRREGPVQCRDRLADYCVFTIRKRHERRLR